MKPLNAEITRNSLPRGTHLALVLRPVTAPGRPHRSLTHPGLPAILPQPMIAFFPARRIKT